MMDMEVRPVMLALTTVGHEALRVMLLGLALWTAAVLGHRNQLAAAALPPAPPNDPETKRLARVLLVVLPIATAGGYALLFFGPPVVSVVFMRILAAALVLFVIWQLALLILFVPVSGVKWELVQSSDTEPAAPRIDRTKTTRSRILSTVTCATLASALVTWLGLLLSTSQTVLQCGIAAFVALVGALPFTNHMSIRLTVGWSLIVVAFSVFLALVVTAAVVLLPSDSGAPPAKDPHKLDDYLGSIQDFGTVAGAFPSVTALFNTVLVVLCWRFDYSRDPSQKAPSIELRTDERGHRCAAVPTSVTRSFPKPYFWLSTATTLLSHLAAPVLLALLFDKYPLSNRDHEVSSVVGDIAERALTDMAVSIFAPVLTCLVASVSVVVFARRRGEMDRLWRYEEVWVRSEAAASALGDEGVKPWVAVAD